MAQNTELQISIHAPLTGCDQTNKDPNYDSTEISIHAPLTGCDSPGQAVLENHLYFNPRTPYGMRLCSCFQAFLLCTISIHAPLTGCDVTAL